MQQQPPLISEGGCLCGALRYRITGTPESSSVCFCRTCRLASGATPVAWIVVRESQFSLLAGRLAVYRSSPPVRRSFCADCGTPLVYQHDDDPQAVELTTATLDEPERFSPTHEIWHGDRVRWAASNAGVARFWDGGETAVGRG